MSKVRERIETLIADVEQEHKELGANIDRLSKNLQERQEDLDDLEQELLELREVLNNLPL